MGGAPNIGTGFERLMTEATTMKTIKTDNTSEFTGPQQKVLDYIKGNKGAAEASVLQARGLDIRAANNLVRKNVLTSTNGVFRLRPQKASETSEKPAKVAETSAEPELTKPAQAIAGARVRLIATKDPHTRLAPGTEGTVDFVDDLGTVFVTWDNGSRLGLVPEAGDRFEFVANSAEPAKPS